MRTVFNDRLDELSAAIAEMCGRAGTLMERATQALLQADLTLSEQVISEHSILAERARQLADDDDEIGRRVIFQATGALGEGT